MAMETKSPAAADAPSQQWPYGHWDGESCSCGTLSWYCGAATGKVLTPALTDEAASPFPGSPQPGFAEGEGKPPFFPPTHTRTAQLCHPTPNPSLPPTPQPPGGGKEWTPAPPLAPQLGSAQQVGGKAPKAGAPLGCKHSRPVPSPVPHLSAMGGDVGVENRPPLQPPQLGSAQEVGGKDP